MVQSTADMGVFPSDAHAIHDALASSDKALHLIPGAHYFEDSQANRNAVADLMAEWMKSRL